VTTPEAPGLNDTLQRSLALTVACGRSLRRWAKRHGFAFLDVYEWSIQTTFRKLVDVTRLHVCDRMIGLLTYGTRVAVRQLINVCQTSKSDAVRVSASRALLGNWHTLHEHFHLEGQLLELEEEAEESKRLRNAPIPARWTPHSPYG
jgi:hypothetical protein